MCVCLFIDKQLERAGPCIDLKDFNYMEFCANNIIMCVTFYLSDIVLYY